MSALVTHGIKISVEAQYERGHSDPGVSRYIFSYHVTIENTSEFTVQLLRRYWLIKASDCSIREVEGDGVIGQQPILEPGSIHSYSSWCPLNSPLGKMSGTYTMIRTIDNKEIVVQIPEFRLITDFILN